MRLVSISALLLSAIVMSAGANAAEGDAKTIKPYTLDTCAISGEKLGDMGDAVVKEYNGQQVKFCCKGCVKKFEKDIDGNLKKVNEEMAKAAADKTKAKPAEHDHH